MKQAALTSAVMHLPHTARGEAIAPASPVELRWLGGTVPATTIGATWGVPWPRGTVKPGTGFVLQSASGEAVGVQTWPLAYWPDGSVKWTGHTIGAEAGRSERLLLRPAALPAPITGPVVSVQETGNAIAVQTGVITCHIPKRGEVLFSSIERDGKAIAQNARLVCLLQDSPDVPENGKLRQESFTGAVQNAVVEQTGPLRAVIRLEGTHRNEKGRTWLPFTIRLYFHAGGDAVRILHSFVFDGDESTDFIRGLGVRVTVPLHDALPDRHVRFSGEGDGLWAEAVQGLTGLRRDPGSEVRKAQLSGKPTPAPDQLPGAVASRMEYIPTWSDYTLTQPNADGFEIRKRTKAGHGWIRAGAGRRASGLGYVGGAVGGGVAFGLRDFWQRHPTQIDIRGAATEQAEITLWLWSPDAPPMDLRFYHDGMGMETHPQELQGLEITYEDYEKGWGTPKGTARTSEITLWAVGATPTRERLVACAAAVRTPPLLACSPEHLHTAGVFGDWGLPDRSTPAKKEIEDQLDYLIALFQKQVEQHRWYGFWDFGDVMHSYDSDRHTWRYDVGGFAWANSELSPDLWLWYSYLRTGRADIFRMAEAMTRHTSEVDTHHLGRFRGLGSRHNVQHWGDSSKQPRVSTAAYRRFYYYLTADERTGDLLRALVGIDARLTEVNIGRKVGGRSTANPDSHDPAPAHPAPAYASFGTDWSAFVAAWLTEWERTGDPKWRDRILNGMRDIGAMKHGWLAGGAGYDPETGHFLGTGENVSISHLNAVFGAVEINSEILSLLEVPTYEKAWRDYCVLYNAGPEEQRRVLGIRPKGLNLGESHSRLTAYAARHTNDTALAERAWREFYAGSAGIGVRTDLTLRRIDGPAVLNPVEEGFGMSTNAASQWCLAAIQNLALIGDHLPARRPGGVNPPADKEPAV